MNVGRTIFFDRASGDIIVDTQEKLGSASFRDVSYYLTRYTRLIELERDSFDFIELEYGQYAQDFAECNGYRVNPGTKELEFSYPDPNEPEQPPVFQKALSEQIKDLELKTDEAIMELSMVIAMGGMG